VWSAARPGRTLPPGKTRYPFYRRLGGPQGRSGRAGNLVPSGIRSRTVQPVVSCYTDWATRPTCPGRHWIKIRDELVGIPVQLRRYKWECIERHASVTALPEQAPGAHNTDGWMDFWVSLDWYGKLALNICATCNFVYYLSNLSRASSVTLLWLLWNEFHHARCGRCRIIFIPLFQIFSITKFMDPTFEGLGLRLLACWDCRFESRRELGCLFAVICFVS